MRRILIRVLAPLVLVALLTPAFADEVVDVANWTAPPYWAPASAAKPTRSALAAATPLPFVAIPPCRIADTRPFGGFSGQYGPPFMSGNAERSFTIAGQCGIPATAQAVSFNFTVTNTAGPGFLLVFPQGGSVPNTSTLNFVGGQTIANAAVVALGTAGGITAAPGVSGIDLLIDVNGYYAPDGVVNSVNALSGALTLAAGTNVTITSSGNKLTIDATAGAGGVSSVAGTNGISASPSTGAVTVTSNATSSNTPSTIVSRDGSGGFEAGAVGVKGPLTFRPGSCWQPLLVLDDPTFGGQHFLKACGGDTFLGKYAGYFNGLGSGENNTGVGVSALGDNINGSFNTAFGSYALWKNTGFNNTAIGAAAMGYNTNASNNTAIGFSALEDQSYDPGGPNWDSANTAIGANALVRNNPTSTSNGIQNTAVGAGSLFFNTIGLKNTALGYGAGSQSGSGTGYGGGPITYDPITTGSGNTFVGWSTGATSTVVVNCTAVGIDAYCDGDNQVRLGNAAVTSIGGVVAWSALSDARAKTDIRDLSLGLGFVLGLRPVAYKLKLGNGRTDMGFLAQDVETLLGDRYNLVGVGGDPDRTRTLRYTDLIAPLVKAIQEQQVMLDARSARVEELERRLAALEERMAPRAESR